MSAPLPTLEELYQGLANDLKSKLNLSDADLKLVADALSAVLAGQFKLAYLLVADNRSNLFPDTADLAEDGGELERLGAIYLNRQPRPATDGKYMLALTGQAGSIIRQGLTFKSNENSQSPGSLFITDNEYELTGVDDFILVRSLQGGIDYSLSVADELTITEPVIGVNQTVTVNSIIELPIESETIAAYRKAIIDAIQLEPQGGSRTDYRLWAADAAGVRLVYPYVKESDAGVVQVFVEATKIDSSDGNGTPTQFILDDVEDKILFDPDITIPLNERGRRPIQAGLEVLPIQLKPVDIEIINMQVTDAATQAAIVENLTIYIETVRPFIAGADLARNKNDILNSARLQGVVFDSLNSGNYFDDLKMFVDGNPINLFTFAGEYIPYLRNITYTNV
ncbi:MAG: baseplate J/gp47 family protein [Bacteroidota bacterium]